MLGNMLARTLDSVGDDTVRRAVVVYEVEDSDGDAIVGYDATEGVTWTDHIGLFRHALVLAEAIVTGLLDQDDDEDEQA
jgi:hypothetical protein